MTPDRSGSPRDASDPLRPFVQLVVPAPDLPIGGSVSFDTRSEATTPIVVSSSLVVESLDDTLAEEFPLLETRARGELRNAIEISIATTSLDLRWSTFESPAVSIRYGPARLSALRNYLMWVEWRCQETEAYVLPHVSLGELGTRWFDGESDRTPERFHDGPARLLVELDPSSFDILSCRPLISPQCAVEAESNFLVAVQRGGRDQFSYLLSQYNSVVVEQAISAGDLAASASERERRDYLEGLSRPTVLGVSTSSDRVWTVSLTYAESDARAGCIEQVTLREVSPWGLTVTGVTRSPLTRSL